MAGAYQIQIEDDIWTLLEMFVTDAAEIPGRLEISGWNPAILYFPDRPGGHTIRPQAAKALVEFHKSLSKAYALLQFGHANRQLLKSDDIKLLDFDFHVIEGSSGLDAWGEKIQVIVHELVGKMTGNQLTAIIVVLTVLYFSSSSYKAWVTEENNARVKMDEESNRLELSEQETKRLALLTDVLQKEPLAAALLEESDNAKRALLRPATKEPYSEILGTPVTQAQAKTILSKPKEVGIGVRLDGIYIVIDINTESEAGYRIRIQNTETAQEFWAAAEWAEIPKEDIDAIFQVAEAKVPFEGSVNAYMVGERIISAAIVRANKIEPDRSFVYDGKD